MFVKLWLLRIPNLEIFLFCQHNSTGGGNLELRQTIVKVYSFSIYRVIKKDCLSWQYN
jgi:hypothetical protein